jgi:hypothetical protein
MHRWILAAAVVALAAQAQAQVEAQAQDVAPPPSPFARKYVEDERIEFDVRGVQHGRGPGGEYKARVRGFVRHDASGSWYEELAWSDLVVNGNPVSLSPDAQRFRQRLSLDPRAILPPPGPSTVPADLAIPVFDLFNLYGNLVLVARTTGLAKAGDHVRIAHNRANSWADGRNVLVGEDAFDFDITVDSVDAASRTAVISVRHVSPDAPAINLVADWMRSPVSPPAANNWTQLGRYPPGKYTAAVGLETIEMKLVVDTRGGRLVSGQMANPVEVTERECSDAEAKTCGEPVRQHLTRRVEITPPPGP